ncbi:MAG: substrate-binding domain-containing protein [Anaerolineales bacterium]|nr:substrate-binding domain-containing protein [Anaerolineales bacterium]
MFGILLVMLLSGCEGAAVSTPTPVTITIGGATAMQRVLRDLTTEFSRQHPSVLFVLRGGGSTLGEEDVARGELDLAASTLYPTVAEGDSSPTPDTLVRIPIGVDALTIVLHPTNSVSQLSLVQLRDIYTGRVIDWQALGSRNGEILLVSREDGSGARAV